jgi:hypothetical protein
VLPLIEAANTPLEIDYPLVVIFGFELTKE